jgi:hypothetical protein
MSAAVVSDVVVGGSWPPSSGNRFPGTRDRERHDMPRETASSSEAGCYTAELSGLAAEG